MRIKTIKIAKTNNFLRVLHHLTAKFHLNTSYLMHSKSDFLHNNNKKTKIIILEEEKNTTSNIFQKILDTVLSS